MPSLGVRSLCLDGLDLFLDCLSSYWHTTLSYGNWRWKVVVHKWSDGQGLVIVEFEQANVSGLTLAKEMM